MLQITLEMVDKKVLIVFGSALTVVCVVLLYRDEALILALSSLDTLSTHNRLVLTTIFLLIWLSTTTGLIPASVLVVLAGSTGGIWAGFLISMAGVFAGALSAFLISGKLLHGPIRRRLSGKFPVEVLETELRSRSWKIVALLRLSPVFPFALVSYALAISGVNRKDFLTGTAGSVPPVFGYVYVGGLTRDTLQSYAPGGASMQPLEIAILGMQVLAVLVVMHVSLKITRSVLKNIGLT